MNKELRDNLIEEGEASENSYEPPKDKIVVDPREFRVSN
jgi:hypothetical protein